MSLSASVSFGSRLVETELNATFVPSAERVPKLLRSLPLIPVSEVEARVRLPGWANAAWGKIRLAIRMTTTTLNVCATRSERGRFKPNQPGECPQKPRLRGPCIPSPPAGAFVHVLRLCMIYLSLAEERV